MLNIFFPDYTETFPDMPIIYDVEEGFSRICGDIPNDARVDKIIEYIDKGHYLNSSHFIDRFGNKLNMTCLSTGCKAALCTLCLPDSAISTYECGANAITAIIWFCNCGNILLDFDYHGIASYKAPEIDVCVNGYCFSSAEKLVDYIENVYPAAPSQD